MELRPYQLEAKDAIFAQWEGGTPRTLLVLPTGCGKTIVFAKVAEELCRAGERVLILAHRGELLQQAADKIAAATGLGCAVEKAEQTSKGSFFPITVGSVQSMMRESRLAGFAPDRFGTIIVDEAHHVTSDSYTRVLDHFGGAKVLGVTATPDRGDMKSLGQIFGSLAYEYTLPRAIKDGFLCRIEAQTIPLKLDLSGVAQQAGDFRAADLGSALDPYLHRIAEEMVTACTDRKTVVFLPLIDTSRKFRDILASHGFAATEVNGASRDRAEALAAFAAAGKGSVLCNAQLLTEGWDQPDVDCIVVLRPTKVRSFYAQMVGRGTRLSPGKESLLLLDFLWHSERHELCRPAHLVCADDEVARRMTKDIEEAGCPVGIEAAELAAEAGVVADREAALAKRLDEMKHRKRKLVDPLQFEMSIQAADLANYEPAFGWEMQAPSAKQLEALEKYGLFPEDVTSAGKAAKLLDRLAERRRQGLATPKQIRLLEGKGFQHVGSWDKEAASALITRISANGWRTPQGIDPRTYTPPPAPAGGLDAFVPWVNTAAR
ncbi:MAG: DEAD/DEAH box helicase [Clostridiales Family XIII bacterium]|nr:DEAD/DEAH box helicase [Clostridiales Family XIII bacterium]